MQGQEVDVSEVPQEGIRRLLSFLPFFKNCDEEDFGVGPKLKREGEGVIRLESSALSPRASEFVAACYNEHFVQSFDWGEWSSGNRKALASDAFINSADLATIIKMLTTHIRAGRFCDGHLLSVMKDGTILKILRRLGDICPQED
jgi:O-acetyl-ADP-ribose deacetylase